MLPNLLPDDQKRTQEQATTFMLMMCLVCFLMMTMWNPAPSVKPDEVLEKPLVALPTPTESASEISETETPIEEISSPPTWVTLGSLEPSAPYQMLVTFTNRGAAVARIELADARYRDAQDMAGYFGQTQVEISDENAPGILQVVGEGTPAHRAGMRAGDEVIAFGAATIASVADLRRALAGSAPLSQVSVKIRRAVTNETSEKTFEELTLAVDLDFSPMDVIRPEVTPLDYEQYAALGGLWGYEPQRSNPLAFRATLYSVDEAQLDLTSFFGEGDTTAQDAPSNPQLHQELAGVHLLDALWELVSASDDEVIFRKIIPARKLEMRKIYRLAKKENSSKENARDGYHLTLTLELKNLDAQPHRLAYQLDGPTGLPLEGAWYSRKTGPGWGTYGIRDVVVRLPSGKSETVSNNLLCYDKVATPWREVTPQYIGVDSTYFQCSMLPQGDALLAQAFPLRVGTRPRDWTILTDVSFRLISQEKMLAAGESFAHEYQIFAGPKKPKVLAQYGLESTLSYGWFWWIVIPMLALLHLFHSFGMNYGAAIIALTIVVRLVMFPVSRKQVLSAIKMQEIQPELAALAEKYKDDLPARQQAQAALFRKHNFNPLSGCLGLFIQLPIFIALYKALSVDVELYGMPLFSKAVRWGTDLSAPDMLFDWSTFWISMGWNGFNTGQGMFYLGPFFNLLPLLTIGLFLAQQWIMMPPPTDEQQRMQRTMMNGMMFFFAFLFFKMPSGLCVYFIASSLWGIAERQLMPKPVPVPANDSHGSGSSAGASGVRHLHDHEKHHEKPRESHRESTHEKERRVQQSQHAHDTPPKSGWKKWLHDIAREAEKKGQVDKTKSPTKSPTTKKGKKHR